MTARLGDDGYQGYGSFEPMVTGGFNPRVSGEYRFSCDILIKVPPGGRFGELQNKLSRSIFDIGRQSE